MIDLSTCAVLSTKTALHRVHADVSIAVCDMSVQIDSSSAKSVCVARVGSTTKKHVLSRTLLSATAVLPECLCKYSQYIDTVH